jgi:chorismate synthase
VTQSENNDELIELTNNNYITHSEFYKGLAQVGQTFGKDIPPSASFKRPSTINATSRAIHPNKQSALKEKGRRIVQMFPKYLEKSGNKK